MEIVFRPATADDAPVWAGTRQKAWAATYRGIYPDSWIDHYDIEAKVLKDRQTLDNPQVHGFLVMDGLHCGGYFSYTLDESGQLYLKTLYLLPEYQGRGLGRQIITQVAQAAQSLGKSSFYCHCNYHNAPARGFYEKMGGQLTGIDGFYENKAQDQCRYDFSLPLPK